MQYNTYPLDVNEKQHQSAEEIAAERGGHFYGGEPSEYETALSRIGGKTLRTSSD